MRKCLTAYLIEAFPVMIGLYKVDIQNQPSTVKFRNNGAVECSTLNGTTCARARTHTESLQSLSPQMWETEPKAEGKRYETIQDLLTWHG